MLGDKLIWSCQKALNRSALDCLFLYYIILVCFCLSIHVTIRQDTLKFVNVSAVFLLSSKYLSCCSSSPCSSLFIFFLLFILRTKPTSTIGEDEKKNHKPLLTPFPFDPLPQPPLSSLPLAALQVTVRLTMQLFNPLFSFLLLLFLFLLFSLHPPTRTQARRRFQKAHQANETRRPLPRRLLFVTSSACSASCLASCFPDPP